MLIDDIKGTRGHYKFIKVNGTYIFSSWEMQHVDLLPQGEVEVQGGGMILLEADWWYLACDRSTTLQQAGYEHYYVTNDMIEELTTLLGVRWRMH